MITVEMCHPQEKGKVLFHFDNGTQVALYRSEARQFKLKEDASITEEEFCRLIGEVVGKRARKRAMHLLERMDRTEHQLRQKLSEGGYPQECVDAAIDYVKSCHYLDDCRYACTFVRFSQEKMSRRQIQIKLLQKGISGDLIEQALDEEYEADECGQILRLLEKRHFVYGETDGKEFQRTYQYLVRRGFRSSDILRVMKRQRFS